MHYSVPDKTKMCEQLAHYAERNILKCDMGEERASCHQTLGILFHISFFCGDKSLHLHSVVGIESVLAVSMLLLVHFLPERSDDVTYN